MSHEYSAMPEHDPSGPYRDGIGVDAVFDKDTLTLTMADGNTAVIPYICIKKGSIRVRKGGRWDLNGLTITLHGGTFTFTDDAPSEGWTEIADRHPNA